MRLILVLLFFPAIGFAQAKMKPLFFPAEKNNIQILAQRFEYALVDSDELRIGDIVIDSAKLRMGFQRNSGGRRLIFTWPAALLSEGTVAVLNNYGKAIWSQTFTPQQLRITGKKKAADDDEEEITRNEIAAFGSPNLDAKILQEMKIVPFLQFCISRVTPETKIYVCSKEVYLGANAQGKTGFLPRATGQREASVEIGGGKVEPQGLIYLNSAKEDLVLRAQTETGAMIEIITRKREIEFKDVVVSEDGKQILVTAKGASPARREKVKFLAEDEYQITLPRQRPYYFVLGEGGMPLRQEFFVKADPPAEKNRPFVEASAPERTYDHSLSLQVTKPAKGSLKADTGGELRGTGGNQFEWTLQNLQVGKKNRRQLLIDAEGKSFVASYEVESGRPSLADVDLFYSLNKGVAAGRLSYRRNMQHLLWIPSESMEFHWAWSAEYAKQLTLKDDVPEIDMMVLGLHWQNAAAFPFEKASWGLGLLLGSATVAKEGSTAFGLEGLYQSPPPFKYGDWMSWWDARARLWPGSNGSGAKLATSWQLETRAYRKLGPQSHWRMGIGLSQFKTSQSLAKEGPQLDLSIGAGTNF